MLCGTLNQYQFNTVECNMQSYKDMQLFFLSDTDSAVCKHTKTYMQGLLGSTCKMLGHLRSEKYTGTGKFGESSRLQPAFTQAATVSTLLLK